MKEKKFEKWVGDTSWTPYQKSIMFLAWLQQQKKIERPYLITHYSTIKGLPDVRYVKVKESDLNELEQQRDEAVELLQFLYDNIENVYTVESAITNYLIKAREEIKESEG